LGVLLGLGLIACVLAYSAVTLGYAALAPLAGWPLPPRTLQQNAYLSLTFQLIFYLLLFAVIYLLVLLKRRRSFWNALSWRNPALRRGLEYFGGGCLLAVLVEFAPTMVPEQSDFPLRQFFSSTALAYTVGTFAVLVAPLMEELIFRGVLFAIFESRFGIGRAVGLTAVLFAMLHIPEYFGAWNHLLLLLLVSAVFSMARGVTGSVAPSFLLHLAYNFTMVLGIYFGTEHFRAVQSLVFRWAGRG
jgi:membrane protease YdiL (CAAX protease family)